MYLTISVKFSYLDIKNECNVSNKYDLICCTSESYAYASVINHREELDRKTFNFKAKCL